jgi:predicted SprT family Zn-dependent metalloprotease
MEEIDSLQWQSLIDKRFTTQVIYPNHTSFKKMYDNYFKVYGLAFLHFKTMSIFIDGQELLKDGYTSNHIYAIEAHEIAHYILQHDKDNPSTEQEKSADVAAIEILEFLKHYEAKNLLIRRFTLLYTCDPNKDDILSPKEKELLISYLKERDNSLMAKIKRFILKFKK